MDSSGWPIPPGSKLRHTTPGTDPRDALLSAARRRLPLVPRWAAGCCGRLPHRPGSFSVSPPRPTPATTTINGVAFHFVNPFQAGVDPSSITDFKGFVGAADVQGTGTARNPDGSVETLLFDTDMRFMQGTYVGLDGAVHEATFGFV